MAFIKLIEKLGLSGVPRGRTNVYSKGYIFLSLNHRREITSANYVREKSSFSLLIVGLI